MMAKFNLPGYVKGKSFADASKSINNKFKDREDKASMDTKMELLDRLAKYQEYMKMQQGLANESQQVPDHLNGSIPEGMEEYSQQGEQYPQEQIQQSPEDSLQQPPIPQSQGISPALPQRQLMNGGFAESKFGAGLQKGASGSAIEGSIGSGLGLATAAVDLGNTAFGDTGVETNGSVDYAGQKANIGGMAASGALKGATAGAALGPIGAGVGALVGGAAGLIGGGRKKKELNEANYNSALSQNSYHHNQFMGGGYMSGMNHYMKGGMVNKYMDGGPFDPSNIPTSTGYKIGSQNDTLTAPTSTDYKVGNQKALNLTQGESTGIDKYVKTPKLTIGHNSVSSNRNGDYSRGTTPTTASSKGKVDYSKLLNQGLRLSPFAHNLSELSNLERNNTAVNHRLNNVYKKDLFDESQAINRINSNYNKGYARESSGGSLGSYAANAAAGELNKVRAVSDAYARGEETNRREGQYQFQNSFRKDEINARLNEAYIDREARDEAAYETTKSNLKKVTSDNLAKVGKENIDKDLVKELTGYSWDGKYFRDKEGNKVDTKKVASIIEQKGNNNSTTNDNMFGGYTMRK